MLLALKSISMSLTASNMIPLGTTAPGFTLYDTVSGDELSLFELRGDYEIPKFRFHTPPEELLESRLSENRSSSSALTPRRPPEELEEFRLSENRSPRPVPHRSFCAPSGVHLRAVRSRFGGGGPWASTGHLCKRWKSERQSLISPMAVSRPRAKGNLALSPRSTCAAFMQNRAVGLEDISH